ncbi:MAG: hypothetical protein GY713_17395 [Actinomycetia bacterium]|nr:hypothetical protein [Actinomycetes bacterium]
MSITPTTPTLEQAGAAVAEADRTLIAAVDQWRAVMVDRLDQLAGALDRHIAETEAADGLFARVLVDAPRLRNEVRRLTREHDELMAAINETREGATDTGLSTNPHRVKALHAGVHDLISLLDRHCHRSCRLLQDSLAVDIGGPVG